MIERAKRLYTIYHIPGVKVGLTINKQGRFWKYPKDTKIKILEERLLVFCLRNNKVMANREWKYADKLGYKREGHYSKSPFVFLDDSEKAKFDFRNGNAGRIGTAVAIARGHHPSQTGKSGFFTGAAGRAGFKAQYAAGKHPSQQPNADKVLRKAQRAALASPNHVSKKPIKQLKKWLMLATAAASVRCSCRFCHRECTPGTLIRWHSRCR